MTQPAESAALTTTSTTEVDQWAAYHAVPTPLPRRFHVKDLARPFGWYVDWVRANPEGASSLTRFSRTFAMLVSEPSDLVQMELCWGAAKVHANVNEAILYTANRRVTLSEGITLLLGATQEVECLMELLVRKYKGNAMAWNAMLGLEMVKSLLNLCMHRQLFLVPWVWKSVRLYIRRVVRRVCAMVSPRASRRTLIGGGPHRDRVLAAGGSNLVGEVAGPGGVHLIIPRVVSESRRVHTHTYYAEQDGGDEAVATLTAAEEEAEREELEAVHFTWVDVLGMLVDCYLLVRPVALVWAARRSFPKTAEAEAFGKPPTLATARQWADQQDKVNKAAAEAAKAKGLPVPKPEKPGAMPTVMDHVMMCPASRSLCGNWRLWGFFVVTDFVVALVSRFIRQHRVPVVYIDVQITQSEEEAAASAAAADGGESRPTRPLPTPPDEVDEDGNPITSAAVLPQRAEIPPMVSRDSLRLQQATRNAAYNFLRDPFFSATLRQFIYDHFVDGFVNRIPLVGAILSYQVSYYLSMQHYSFLYTVGQ